MDAVPWYETLFGEEYLRIYGVMLSEERTAREVDGILRLLALPRGSAVLDLACGHGRHAIPLAERGYRVTGLDLSTLFLSRARAEEDVRGVHVHWVHGDMRELPFEGEFDAVINIFTAFGYFDDEAENQRVLREVHRALRPGGCFLIDTMHRDGLVRGFQPYEVSREEDDLLVIEERRFDQLKGRNVVRVTLIYPDGSRTELGHDVRVYTATELAGMIVTAGLDPQIAYGGLDGTPLTLQSRRLVMLAKKPGS